MIIVPTKYYKVPTDHFKDLGVSLIIWANHNLRASIAAIQQTTKQIYTDQSLVNVEEKVGLKRRGKGKGGLFQKKKRTDSSSKRLHYYCSQCGLGRILFLVLYHMFVLPYIK